MKVVIANISHSKYAEIICETIEESAKVRGTGIAQRTPEYIIKKISTGDAVIAIENDEFAGFCYIETWDNASFVVNSGLIVHPNYRNQGLAKTIKKKILEYSKEKYPDSKIFGITTGLAVLKINYELGYQPVTFSELTTDEAFWNGCRTCKNFDVLTRTERKMCLCTGMLYDPKHEKNLKTHKYNSKVLSRLKRIINKVMEKVVVAYSGGLDTSYCVKYLQNELNLEVHSVLVNTGGFSSEELKIVEAKAYDMGVKSHTNQNILDIYYDKAIKYMVYGNVLKNNTYPLSVSAERVFQAIEVVEYAKKINAKYIAHGSTGAGNDQVRFDMIFQTLAPNIEIITPIRDLKLSRQEEISYLEKHGVDYPWSKAKYSINKGIWGTSVGGVETLTSHQALPEEAYPSQLEKTEPTDIKLHFEKGQIVGLNDEFDTSVNTILKLEAIASKYAIGRDIHVGDTIVGIKGRVGFEAAAATVIIKAHHLLEKHVLSKWQQNLKEGLGSTYGMLLHDGQYFEPAMRDIEAYLTNSQKTVTGEVFVTLKPYHFSLNGIESKHDLMKSKFGEYGETNKAWSAEDAKGFIKILGTANKIYHSVNSEL